MGVKPEGVEALVTTTAYNSHFIGKKVERLNDLFKLALTQLVNTLYCHSFDHTINIPQDYMSRTLLCSRVTPVRGTGEISAPMKFTF